MSEYPESEKMRAIADKSQAIGEFLDWAASKGWHLMELAMLDCDARRCTDEPDPDCERCEGTGLRQANDTWRSAPGGVTAKLAEFYEIDLDVIEEERRAMLADLQSQ